MEELAESKVMWPNDEDHPIGEPSDSMSSDVRGTGYCQCTRPIDIQCCTAERTAWGSGHKDEEGAADEMVPPHLLIELRGRAAGNAAFSVCYGQGRTLKGRDLAHVRDSVLRMTGFLEGQS
uniref:Uncharacterized protein n=1 Tax=Ananas comosus var. bracteatus TaxID=296719 RepID=A0A6V7PT09_ANACO|nr:unnamed protein product [Ananas comosus var. bracteatus]